MSNTNNKSSINPGYGYRLLKTGERVEKNDEFDLCGQWAVTACVGRVVGSHSSTTVYRRKIDVGTGFRLVGENETVQGGDEFQHRSSALWAPCSLPIGETPASRIEYDGSYAAFRRPVPVPAPAAPKPALRDVPPGNPPAGYRWLKRGETITTSDVMVNTSGRLDILDDPQWVHLHGRRVGEGARDLGDNGAAVWKPFARKLEAPKPVLVDPGVGYRLLGEDEPILAGDQINDTDGTWQSPLRRDDPPTLRQRRKHLSTPESRRAWPGRAEQIQVRRKVEAPKPAAAWRQLAPGELVQLGDEVTCKASDDIQAPSCDGCWAQHRVGDAGIGRRVEGGVMRYRRRVEVPTDLSLVVKKLEGELKTANEKLASMQKNATGNVVLVTCDGFSKPSDLANPGKEVRVPFRTIHGWGVIEFLATGTTDGFGRAVYKQAA